MAANSSVTLELLPNEILHSVLSTFATRELFPLAAVNRQFHCITSRILYQRLIQTAPLPRNRLILECYHPSDQFYTPYLSCQYMGTVSRDGPGPDESSPALPDLRRIFASFRPQVAEENRRPRQVPVRFQGARGADDPESDIPTQDVYLDEGELFSQLCVAVNLVKEGPRRGFFKSHFNMIDGVVRIFRQWLVDNSGPQAASDGEQDSILWVDHSKDIGIRFQVKPAASETMPLLSGPGDEPPVAFTLVYTELLVRAYSLLEAVEQSAVQEIASSGTTLVIHGL